MVRSNSEAKRVRLVSLHIPLYSAPASRRRLILTLVLIPVLLAMGTIGYMVVERWPVDDAFFMTVITVSTVGYGEVRPLDAAGRLFSSALILVGVGTLFYSVTAFASWLIEGQLSGGIMEQQLRRQVAAMHDHVVVCGFGRVGQRMSEELARDQVPVVVVDADPTKVAGCRELGLAAMEGDATRDEVLLAAGIERARGLAVALDDDAKNVFITLSGRALNPALVIVARAALQESEAKLLHAGANRVVSPYAMSGERMAQMITRPNVVRFLDVTMRRTDAAFAIEEFEVPVESAMVGQTYEALAQRSGGEVAVVAVFGSSGLVTNPAPSHPVEPGSTIVVIGRPTHLEVLRDLLRPAR